MSEGTSTTTTSVSAPVASTSTSSESTAKSSVQSTQSSSGQQSQTQGHSPNQTSQPQESSDGLEEISLGSTKGRVPKEIAKAVKEYERGIQAKFRQNAEMQKQFQEKQQLLDLFEQDPEKFFKAQGKNFDEMAEERLARKYEMMQMSPDAREAMELKQQIQEMRSQELASKSDVISEIKDLLGTDAPQGLETAPKEHLQAYLNHQKQMMTSAQKEIETEFLTAWQETGLPKDPFFGAQMAFRMMRNKNSNQEPLTASQAANKVKSEFTSHIKSVITQLDPKGILELIGEDGAKKLREYELAKVQGVEKPIQSPAQAASTNQPKKYMNEIEWRKYMGLS